MSTLSRLFPGLLKKRKSGHRLKIPGFPHALSMEVHEATDIHISAAIVEEGIWEPDETHFIIDVLAPGDTFVDVGANIGYFTLIASKIVGPEGRVYAFEPDRENFKLLQANCQANDCDNVLPIEAALSNESGEGELYLNETNKGDHTIYPAADARSSVKISLLDGSEVFPVPGEKISFLKIDTQGSEYQVIEGLSAAIENSLPELVIIVEFSPNSMRLAGHGGEAFVALFASFEGEFYILDKHHCGLIPISREHLTRWANFTERDPRSEGFINLLFSGRPLEERAQLQVVSDLGLFDHALEYLTGESLPRWNGERLVAGDISARLHFSSGWSFPEEWGSWSLGRKSTVKCHICEDLQRCESATLVISGRYFGDPEETAVEVNGVSVGRHDLTTARISLPPGCAGRDHLIITLAHDRPLRPADVSDSSDHREIKFGIESIEIEQG